VPAQLATEAGEEAMNRAKRRDSNETPIVDALRGVGAAVTRLNEDGVPDLLVGFRGHTFLLEVKHPLGPRGGFTSKTTAARAVSGTDLTAPQVGWWAAWNGEPAIVVRSPAEALAAIGAA
jgi:hypothetical protein